MQAGWTIMTFGDARWPSEIFRWSFAMAPKDDCHIGCYVLGIFVVHVIQGVRIIAVDYDTIEDVVDRQLRQLYLQSLPAPSRSKWR